MQQALSILLSGRIEAMAGVDQTFYWAIREYVAGPVKLDHSNGDKPADD